MEKIRFGVVGTNFITDWVIAGGREDERFELSAVCSRSEQTAKAYAEKQHIPHHFTSLEAMAASQHIDAVYIASPNAFHAQQSILCMQHGKHVLCEKSFASNAREVRMMIETAHQQGVVLMEAMKPTLTPSFDAVRNQLHQLGVIRRYFSCYCQYSSRYDKLKEGIVLNAFLPEMSNCSTMDIGVYTIYPMVVLFGKPATIHAVGTNLSTGVDGQAAVNFTYSNGMVATALYSKIADSALPTEIQGEAGTVRLDRINIISEVTFIDRKGGKISNIRPETPHHEYYYEIAEFINIIQSGRKESLVNSLANSLMTIEIMDEIRKQLGVHFPADQVLPVRDNLRPISRQNQK